MALEILDIFNTPAEIEIDGKKYLAEYDNRGYATLETLTGKGIYKLYNLLMKENNLTLNESIEIVCCSLLKHHKTDEIADVRKFLNKNLYIIKDLNEAIIWAFTSPLLSPEITKSIKELKDLKKKTQAEAEV